MTRHAQNLHETASQRGSDLMSKLASLEMPTQVDYAYFLLNMDIVLGIILLIGGAAYLLRGWKIFKILVILNAAVMGGVFGSQFGQMLRGANMPLFGGIAGVLLFAVLAWPLMKFGVSLMGGLAGSFLGFGVWSYVSELSGKEALAEHAWAGGLIGLIGLGLLAFVIFKLVIMIFTSVQGSLMIVSGTCCLLMHLNPLRDKLHTALASNMHLLALLICVPAVIGFAFQYTAMASRVRRKRKVIEGNS